jgi:hypothetical protein
MSMHHDERITATQQRWAATGFWLLFIALAIDVLVRELILKQEPRQWLDISLISMAAMLYVAIGTTASGVAPYGGRWWKAWPIIPLVAVLNTVLFWRTGIVRSPVELISSITVGIIGATAGLFVALVIVGGIYAVWERKTLGHVPREE